MALGRAGVELKLILAGWQQYAPNRRSYPQRVLIEAEEAEKAEGAEGDRGAECRTQNVECRTLRAAWHAGGQGGELEFRMQNVERLGRTLDPPY